MIIRDPDGFAQGKLFLDEGVKISEITNKSYEYYEFKLVNKTLQKLTINSDGKMTGRQGIGSIIITNAEDLNATDKACFISKSGFNSVVEMQKPEYDPVNKTLTLRAMNGTINAFEM